MASTTRTLRILLKLQDEMSKPLEKATNRVKDLSSNLTSMGTRLSATVTAPLVGIGLAASKMAMDFDRSLRNIQSITKQTDESLKGLGQQFLDLSMDMTKTTDSADNLAKGYYQIISSGVDAADAMRVLEVATKAASAGLTTTEVAVEGITGVLNAYGFEVKEASYVSDVMFETVNRGVVTFEELNTALGNVTGLAAQLDVPFREVAAAIATMTKQNIDASTATTNLNGILTALIRPTEEMKKAIEELGYSSGSAMLESLGLAGTLNALAEYADGSAEKMGELFSDVRALRGVMALTGEAAGMFAEDLAAMGASAGATQAAFDEQMKSFDAAWKNFQNTIGVALIEIGNILLPFLADLLKNYITPLVEWFISLDDTTQAWIIGIAAVIAALGPLLIIFGQIAGAISAIAGLAPIFAGLAPIVATAVAAILSPLGLFLATVGIITAAILGNWFGLRDGLVSIFGSIVNAVTEFISVLFSGNYLGVFLEEDNPIITFLFRLREAGLKIVEFFKWLPGQLWTAWSEMLNKAKTAFLQLGFIIAEALKALPATMLKIGQWIIQGLIDGVKSKIGEFINWVKSMADQAAQAVRNALGIRSPSKVMMEMGKQVVAGFNKGIESFGGLGVNVNGTSVSGGASPMLAGASGGGGGTTIQHNVFQLPLGTTDEMVREIERKLGERAERRGARRTP